MIGALWADQLRRLGVCAQCCTVLSWRQIRQGALCVSCRIGRHTMSVATVLNDREWAFEGVHQRYSFALVSYRKP